MFTTNKTAIFEIINEEPWIKNYGLIALDRQLMIFIKLNIIDISVLVSLKLSQGLTEVVDRVSVNMIRQKKIPF